MIDRILKEKKEKNDKKSKGALILTPTKELCAQIYRQIRLLDPLNLLRVYRTGSISHIAPIVQYLVYFLKFY